MTLNLAAIFGDEPVTIIPVVTAPEAADLDVDDRAVASPAPWPIVEGAEHYQVFVPDEDSPWPEFIPGHHYDFRQPSRLLSLIGRKETTQ